MTENANGGAAGAAGAGAAGGGGTAPWHGGFAADAPQEFQQWVANKAFADPQAALLSAYNQEKLIGADRAGRTVVLPKDANDLEGTKAFRAKLGVPETLEGYKVPAALAEALKDDPILPAFAASALKHGVPAAAYEGLLTEVIAAANAQQQRVQQEAQGKSAQELETLKGEWGEKFTQNSEFARRFLKASGLEEADVTALEQSLGTAKMLKTFQAWGSKIAEHNFAGADTGGGGQNARAVVNTQMSELRTKRIANQITEADYLREMERLGKLSELAA